MFLWIKWMILWKSKENGFFSDKFDVDNSAFGKSYPQSRLINSVALLRFVLTFCARLQKPFLSTGNFTFFKNRIVRFFFA